MLFVFVPRTHSNLHMFCRGNKICRDAVHDLELTFPSQTWTTITRTSLFFNYNPFSNAHSHTFFDLHVDSPLSVAIHCNHTILLTFDY